MIAPMNKAFVREPDEDVPDRLPELPLPPPPNPVTEAGLGQIKTALEAVERRLADATARPERAEAERLQREARYWAARLATARLTLPPVDADIAGFGSHLTIAWPGRGEVGLSIVGNDEADPKAGLIAWRAPVAAALVGHGTGERVVVQLAGREVELTILAVCNVPQPPEPA